ncbi:KpsF/GutQ family sugar-phosphate isomerase [Roseospira visakhapatnamensis]|uniref:Arabinose-5-phosphate isomerase n=1 Tax=Roseospira visakhapatnamensis TaxID=390880 RepID=A0A7W6RFP4_9PROT|nr:KpsF/GutQ family sugar-phosphate isomerase [Roseospira visakhapatnamensis]MBB4267480.1 arabinose-5-phosphate isomerase [Roseospira visakhapatnamensis]
MTSPVLSSKTSAARAVSSEVASATATDILDVARRVLRAESEALAHLAESVGPPLGAAVSLIQGCKGRVTVTGMGKSGHVGRKIAATLASTGTLAQYVHPAEASHGDLGMVCRDDVVLALSNSGDTPELNDMIAYTRRFGIGLIGLTSRAEGALAQSSDVALVLPPHREACPLGLAPTTSTTMMLALGDALAVALLEARGFSARDFQVFHPGGQLGRALLRVADLMHTGARLPLVTADTPMSRALIEISSKGFGCVGILDDTGALIGIITDGDLRRHMADGLLSRPSAAIMTASPRTVTSTTLAVEALHLMNASDRPFMAVFVVDDGKPVGVLHMHDLLRAGLA